MYYYKLEFFLISEKILTLNQIIRCANGEKYSYNR